MRYFQIIIPVIVYSLLSATGSNAQTYSIHFAYQAIYTLPKTETLYSQNQDGSFYSPVTDGASLGITRKVGNRLFVGVGVGIQDLLIFQEIKEKSGNITGNVYSFMRNGPGCSITLLEANASVGYTLPINEKQQVNLILTPGIAHYINGSKIMDTTEGNAYRRDPKNLGRTLYLNYQQINRTGLNFLVNIAVEYERKLGQRQRFSLTGAIAYQQGFRYFMEYTGYMGVRGISEGIYTSKVSGSCLQLNLGVKYNFGFKERATMLHYY